MGVPALPFDRPQNPAGDGARTAAGDADDADASAAEGSRNGGYGVVEDQ